MWEYKLKEHEYQGAPLPEKKIHLLLKLLSVAIATALLAACGGSSESHRGSLIESPVVLTNWTVAQIDAGTAASSLQGIADKAKCDVKMVALNYTTVGVNAEPTNASGVLLLPSGNCTGPAPLLAYARGTEVMKTRTLANPIDGDSFALAAMFASQGYAVVATDYLGYAKSTYAYHPYLHADSEASVMVDSIRAARNAGGAIGFKYSGKVMLSGYSQGAHASMAAHRAIERDHSGEISVSAGAHLAGPFNVSGLVKLPVAVADVQFFLPFLVTSWQKVYGNVYSDVKTVFKAPYADYIESLLPSSSLTYDTLVTSGKLPGALNETPTQARDAMFQKNWISDVQNNENNGAYLAAKKNDLLGWSPKAKVLLCGGSGDQTVPPPLHQAVMKADFDSRLLTNVASVDVDALVQAKFGVNGKTPTDSSSTAFATYFRNYHSAYEPPFCYAQAKAFFDPIFLS